VRNESKAPRVPVELDALERRTFFAAVTVDVNPAQQFQTIEGLGAAMIGWANRLEYQDPAYYNMIVGDLGASMVRANIEPTTETINDNDDPNTFNWAGFNAAALEPQFRFFQQMQARGVNTFVNSIWTAPNWMKTNWIFREGGSLRADMRAEFAEYVSAVTQLAKNAYGIELDGISLQNEPYFVEPNESTTYDAIQMREALRATMRKFKADGVTTKILVPEDLIHTSRNEWYLKAIMDDPETRLFNGAIAGHGLNGHWGSFGELIAPYNKPFWMTETSGHTTDWPGALALGESILNALGTANAAMYAHWQFSDHAENSKFALMTSATSTTPATPNIKYYAAKHFYRYIRPGMVHVASNSSLDTPANQMLRVVSFKNPSTGAMTHVIINKDTGRTTRRST
jgi:O-glycosyl hydrolase